MVLVSAIVGGGIGALIGALIQSTEKGKKMDQALREGFKTYDEEIKDRIPMDKLREEIEES